MFLAVHAAVGAIAGNSVESPTAAFALGFISHFFIDMIPHGDADMYEGYKSGEKKKLALIYLWGDVLATIALIVLFFIRQDFFSPLNVALGIVGGLLPDIIVGLFEILKPRRHRWAYRKLESFHALHMRNHAWFGKFLPTNKVYEQANEFMYDLKFNMKAFTERDIPLRYGLMLQGIMLFICLKAIL